jgi:hypothetical protein
MDKQEVVHILRERESACVYAHVALVIQYAKHMVPYYVVIWVLSCSAVLFFILSHKWHNFQKEFIVHKMCVDFPYNFYLKPLSS